MTRDEIISKAFDVGIVFVKLPDAYCNAVDLPIGTYGAVNDVEVFQLEQFAALAIAHDRQRLAAGVELPKAVGDGYTLMVCDGDTPSTMMNTRISVVGVETFTLDQLRDYGDRRAAAENEACRAACEAIADEYQKSEGGKYPELKSDAQTGASDCEYAVRKRMES